MSASVFHRLYSHRPRIGRRPEEDYFTEAFVAVMERAPALLRVLVTALSGIESVHAAIFSQRTYALPNIDGLGRPDIVIESKTGQDQDHILFMENKLQSIEGKNQLHNYYNILSTLPGQHKTLLYVTQYAEEEKSVPTPQGSEAGVDFRQFRWRDIYRILDNRYKELQESEQIFLGELLNFMKEINMVPEMTLMDLIAVTRYPKARKIFSDFLHEFATKHDIYKWALEHTVGKWSYSGLGNDDIAYTSPTERVTGVQISFGFWLNTSEPGPVGVVAEHSDLPVAYVSLRQTKGDAQKAAIDKFISNLSRINWKPGKYDWDYFLTKSKQVVSIGNEDLLQGYEQFFSEAFQELREAGVISKEAKETSM